MSFQAITLHCCGRLADLQQRWQSARGSDNFVEAEGDAPAAASGAPSGATKKPSGKKGEKASGGKKKSKKVCAMAVLRFQQVTRAVRMAGSIQTEKCRPIKLKFQEFGCFS